MALRSMVPIYFNNICSSIFHTLKMCMELTLSCSHPWLSGSHPWLSVRPKYKVWKTTDEILSLPCPRHPLDELFLEGESGWAPLLLKSSLKESYGRKPMMNLSSVQFSHSVMSDSLRPHEPQHARPPCPSPTPRVQPNPCPLSWWCHRTISSSVAPFSSCPQSFPASGKDWSFQMSQFFTSSGQIIGVSASASVLPIQDFQFRTDFL